MRQCFLLLSLVFCSLAQAQQDVGGFFHVTVGVSLPEGDFASNAPDNTAAGYANTGFTVNALFGHKIHKRFGGFAMLSFAAHPIDHVALSESLNQNAGTYQWKAEQAFWSVTGFTFGPQWSYNFKKAAIDFRLSAGALNFISPELVIRGTSLSSEPPAVYTRKKSQASSLVLGGGITFKYEVKWGWVILANADYFAARPEFLQVEQNMQIDGQDPVRSFSDFKQEFIMLQFGTGVGYVF
ncbi:MAG: hypothetical protein ACYC1Q_12895 [Bacteroidia bacterium]